MREKECKSVEKRIKNAWERERERERERGRWAIQENRFLARIQNFLNGQMRRKSIKSKMNV